MWPLQRKKDTPQGRVEIPPVTSGMISKKDAVSGDGENCVKSDGYDIRR